MTKINNRRQHTMHKPQDLARRTTTIAENQRLNDTKPLTSGNDLKKNDKNKNKLTNNRSLKTT
jgi:hypothetical protein